MRVADYQPTVPKEKLQKILADEIKASVRKEKTMNRMESDNDKEKVDINVDDYLGTCWFVWVSNHS